MMQSVKVDRSDTKNAIHVRTNCTRRRDANLQLSIIAN
jgi:hypothetical protein